MRAILQFVEAAVNYIIKKYNAKNKTIMEEAGILVVLILGIRWWYRFDSCSFDCQKGNQRRMNWKQGRKEESPRMKGSTGKFGLVNEENLICSALDILRRRGCRASSPRRLYRRPLCGLLLSALVFINGMTCSWSLDFRRRNALREKCNSSADSIVIYRSVLFIIEKNL